MMDAVRRSSTHPRRQPGLRLSLSSTICNLEKFYNIIFIAHQHDDRAILVIGLQSVCQYVFLTSYPNFLSRVSMQMHIVCVPFLFPWAVESYLSQFLALA